MTEVISLLGISEKEDIVDDCVPFTGEGICPTCKHKHITKPKPDIWNYGAYASISIRLSIMTGTTVIINHINQNRNRSGILISTASGPLLTPQRRLTNEIRKSDTKKEVKK